MPSDVVGWMTGESGGCSRFPLLALKQPLGRVAASCATTAKAMRQWRLCAMAIAGGRMVDSYSFGTRQTLAAHFANNSDPAIVMSSHLGAGYIPTLQVRSCGRGQSDSCGCCCVAVCWPVPCHQHPCM
jgi:hypothetical protein